MRAPLWPALKPWAILGFLEFGKRTEVLLGPGLGLTPEDFQGERPVSVFPQNGINYSGKNLGRQFLNYFITISLVLSK